LSPYSLHDHSKLTCLNCLISAGPPCFSRSRSYSDFTLDRLFGSSRPTGGRAKALSSCTSSRDHCSAIDCSDDESSTEDGLIAIARPAKHRRSAETSGAAGLSDGRPIRARHLTVSRLPFRANGGRVTGDGVARWSKAARTRASNSAVAFAQDDAEAARAQWRKVADQLRPKLPKLAAFLPWRLGVTKSEAGLLRNSLFNEELPARRLQSGIGRLTTAASCGRLV
jgi:hypothetical protein